MKMQIMRISSHAAMLTLFVFLACSGRGGSVAQGNEPPPNGGGGGLRIDGTCTWESPTHGAETIPIDIDTLREDAMSFCYDQIVDAEKGGQENVYSMTEEHCDPDPPVPYCSPWFCSMQLAICVGQLMMSIADAVENIELHVQRYEGGDLSHYVFTGAEQSSTTDDYIIYPQSTKNKTLALREAMAAFRYAGLAGSMSLLNMGPYCLTDLVFDPDYNDQDHTIYNSKGEPVSIADLFSVTYAEGISLFDEATKRTTQNVVNVADSMMSEERNYSKAVGLMWNGDTDNPDLGVENSRKAAILTLYGTPYLSPEQVTPIASSEIGVPIDRESIRNAIKLLQSTRVVAVGGGTGGPGERLVEDVVDDIRVILNEQFGTETDPYPFGSQTSDNDELLRMFGTSSPDIEVARKYLDQLVRTFKKTQVIDEELTPARQYGYMDAVKNNPAAYWKGDLATDQQLLLDPANMFTETLDAYIDCNYANVGTAQSFDFFRMVTTLALDSESIPEDYRKFFIHAAKNVSGLVGDGRIVVNYLLDSETGELETVAVDVFGVVIPEGMVPSDYFTFFVGEEGYECVQYGSLDDFECHPEDYQITGMYEDYDPDGGFHLLGPSAHFEIVEGDLPAGREGSSTPALTPDWPISIYYQNPTGGMSLLFKVNIPAFQEYPGYNPMAMSPVSLIGTQGPGTVLGESRDTDPRSVVPNELDHGAQTASFHSVTTTNAATGKVSCAGLPYDFVPPLENEITQDADPYENSWRHYLNLAKEAATEADELGEELINAGLEMDMRAEAAIEALEEICGDVGDLDTGIWGDGVEDSTTSNDNLINCLYNAANHINYVGLGNKNLCIYKDTVSGVFCKCREEECFECPAIIPENGDACTEKPGYEETPVLIDHETSDPSTGLLEIFDAEGTKATANCDDLQYLREYLLRNYKDGEGNRYYPISPGNPICHNSNCTIVDPPAKNRLVTHLDEAGLFDSDYLGNLLSNLELRHSFYGYYYAKILGTQHFSMDKLGDSAGLCPIDNKTEEEIDCSSYDERTEYGIQAIKNAIVLSYFTASTPKIIEGGFLGSETKSSYAFYHPDMFSTAYYWEGDAYHHPSNWRKGIYLNTNLDQNLLCNSYIDTNASYDRPQCNLSTVSFWDEGDIVMSNDVKNRVSKAAYSSADEDEFWPCGAPTTKDAWYQFEHSQHYLDDIKLYMYGSGTSMEGFWPIRVDLLYKIYANWGLCLSSDDSYYDECVNLSLNYCTDERTHISTLYDGIFDDEGANENMEKILNALLFACEISETATHGRITGNVMPDIETEADLLAASNYFKWLGDTVRRTAARIVLTDLHVEAYHGIKQDNVSYLYPGYRGQHLEEMNNLMVNLNDFKRSALALSNQMNMVATQIDLVRTSIQGLETEKKIVHIQKMKEILDRTQEIAVAVIDVLASASIMAPWSSGAAASKAAIVANIQALNIAYTIEEEDLEMEAIETETRSALIQCYQSLSSINTSIQETVLDIFDSFYGTSSSMERIMALEIEAQQLAERAGFSDDPDTARVYHVNTVMRMRYNTLLTRYNEAFARAKKLAMIAKRAIEFRFGVDLMDMTEDMILVPAPKTWAAQICTMQGIDYERIRESNPDEIEDGYADAYIGDYVQKLEDFAESYPMDYPFMEADDTAVISMKNDYFNETVPCPARLSTNLLSYSEDLGSSTQVIDKDTGELQYIVGWQEDRSECESDDPCIEVWEDAPVACGESPLPPCDLIGRADHLLETGEEAKPGFVYQVVRDLPADWYVLGWKHLFIAGSTPVPYGVRVSEVVDEVETPLEWHEFSPTSTNEWEEGFIAFQLDVDASVKIEVHPSYSDDTEDPPGDVWLWGFQLNKFEGDDYLIPAEDVRPKTYEKTDSDRFIIDETCQDLDGRDFRMEFTHNCVGETECYYETQFSVNLQDIENGSYFTSDVISTNNYNYRHKSIALNFVGTNIKDCTRPDATSSCYENAFIPYTLIHGGVVSIRNHEFQYEDFSMVTGKIEHGKGLAAEVVVTNPLTGSQPSLLDPYMNAELRGRPIQGQYTLRIYDTPELDWDSIEDIQLIWDYHYWTKFGI